MDENGVIDEYKVRAMRFNAGQVMNSEMRVIGEGINRAVEGVNVEGIRREIENRLKLDIESDFLYREDSDDIYRVMTEACDLVGCEDKFIVDVSFVFDVYEGFDLLTDRISRSVSREREVGEDAWCVLCDSVGKSHEVITSKSRVVSTVGKFGTFDFETVSVKVSDLMK